MTRYAANTSVPADRSRNEIEKTVTRYGATSFIYGFDGPDAVIGFTLGGRTIRINLPLPPAPSPKLATAKAMNAHAQSVRQRWRAMALMCKAKLEEEWLAHLVLPGPGGKTVGEKILPELDRAAPRSSSSASGGPS